MTDYKTIAKQLDDERAARIDLQRAKSSPNIGREWIDWKAENGDIERLEIPLGLDKYAHLRIIDIFDYAIERGKREGREELKRDFSYLMGVSASD